MPFSTPRSCRATLAGVAENEVMWLCPTRLTFAQAKAAAAQDFVLQRKSLRATFGSDNMLLQCGITVIAVVSLDLGGV